MINSMTGFASGEIQTEHGQLLWELRTVNHRYLEAQLKLPDSFRSMEPELREVISAQLQRGKLDASLQFRHGTGGIPKTRLNTDLAAQIIQQAQALADQCASPGPIAPLDLLRWPGVIEQETLDSTVLFAPASELLESTLNTLCESRAREGERIQVMLEERLAQITVLATQVRERMPVVLENIRGKLSERARALEVRVDAERLEQELVLLAQKMDVAEELDRLEAHVEETRTTFKQDGAVGRRLDFLMQEFNREANTLGSKSADPETTKAAVDLKVLIEQMREQVQNVE